MSNKKLGQEPAFGSSDWALERSGQIDFDPNGMSKRFYAACAAMQGMLASRANPGASNPLDDSEEDIEKGVKTCYKYADELLKQEKEEEKDEVTSLTDPRSEVFEPKASFLPASPPTKYPSPKSDISKPHIAVLADTKERFMQTIPYPHKSYCGSARIRESNSAIWHMVKDECDTKSWNFDGHVIANIISKTDSALRHVKMCYTNETKFHTIEGVKVLMQLDAIKNNPFVRDPDLNRNSNLERINGDTVHWLHRLGKSLGLKPTQEDNEFVSPDTGKLFEITSFGFIPKEQWDSGKPYPDGHDLLIKELGLKENDDGIYVNENGREFVPTKYGFAPRDFPSIMKDVIASDEKDYCIGTINAVQNHLRCIAVILKQNGLSLDNDNDYAMELLQQLKNKLFPNEKTDDPQDDEH